MAYDDIQAHSSPRGGTDWVQHFPMETGVTFGKGDFVKMDTDGQITECVDEEDPEDILGLAMAGPSGPGASTLNNPRTGTTYADGDRIPVLISTPGQLFRTKNYTLAGTAFDDTVPDTSIIGQLAAIALIGGVWGIDSAPAANSETCRIMDVLNGRRESIADTGETLTLQSATPAGKYEIVFALQGHAMAGSTTIILVQN